jgi:hypothetical protein
MKVMLSSCETLEVSRRDTNGHVQPPPLLDPSPFHESNGQTEAPSEPGSAEIEYVASEDLKDLPDADVQLTVSITASYLGDRIAAEVINIGYSMVL